MIRARTVMLSLVLMAGCATEAHRFRYEPPASVRAADREYCHMLASSKAHEAYARYEDMMEVDALGRLSGQTFGGTATPLAAHAWEEREAAYESEMRACLSRKGDSQ